jgi:hypothetical protein
MQIRIARLILLAAFAAVLFTKPLQVFAGPLDEWNFTMVSVEHPERTSLDYFSENYTLPAFGPWGIPHEMMSFELPLKDILDGLQKDKMYIALDCSLFVQIAALSMNKKLERPGARLFAMGSADGEDMAKFFGRTFAYVHPEDSGAAEKLQQTHYLAKGHWLLKVANNRYLGLSLDGSGSFKTQSGKAWQQETKKALFAQMKADERSLQGCDSDLIGLSRREATRRISFNGTKFFRENGRLESWKLTEFAP